MKEINLNELKIIYKRSISFLRANLCRPEFNQFRIDQNDRKFYVFKDCENFHKMFKYYLQNKKKYRPKG